MSAIALHDRSAAFGWASMGLWLGMLGLMSWVLHRDGPHPGQAAELQYGVFGLFWLVGIPAAAHLWAQPCTRFAVAADGSLTITRRSLFGRAVEAFPPGSIARVETRPAKDDEGDPVFRVVAIAADGRERLARQHPDEAAQQALAARLRLALGVPPGLLAESPPGD